MAVVLFGGNFDPPTLAHEAIIKCLSELDNCEELIVLPAGGARYDKSVNCSFRHRKAMLKVIVDKYKKGHSASSIPPITVSSLQAEGELEKSYTVDLLRKLRVERPKASFLFVIGSDRVSSLPQWKESQALFQMVEFLVITRSEEVLGNNLLKELSDKGARMHFIDNTKWVPVHASSSEVRERLKEKTGIRDLVSEEIQQYILNNGLYSSISA